MLRTPALLALLLCLFSYAAAAQAGEWLGGQYWGQISGCGECGGSLYGGAWMGFCCQSCRPESLPDGPVPATVTPTPATIPTRLVSFSQAERPDMSSRRNSQQRVVESPPSYGTVKTVTHASRPERLYEEPIRLVAPNAWSDPIRR